MTGPEHYREAERLLEAGQSTIDAATNDDLRDPSTQVMLAVTADLAGAHAALAQTAATLEAGAMSHGSLAAQAPTPVSAKWQGVVS